ncbi:hypothetical protein [Rivibacter subsaxonicus]|uniref:hypothetical protein n=1 Tax=Rivibacter subsaxonicus TaxID=457575 RepID=UPI00102C5149|nr:hypothetical protein [Rivibacter subsaxonicus]
MNTPTPALVPQRAAERLPRIPLLLLCAAYVLPGLFGRDPWRSADVTAFGYMASIARGASAWWAPSLGGLPADGALLPSALGAASIHLFGGWLGAPLAARLPFALLLVGVLICTWYAAFHLARTEAAQPVAFAFGGEAKPVDYARAIADGALLALLATLGLLQLGHETTPELTQLFGGALFLYAMAAAPWRARAARLAVIVALPVMAMSGAPVIALALAAAGLLICLRSRYAQARAFAPWLFGAALLAAALASLLGQWAWRLEAPRGLWQPLQLLLWFAWPAWALAGWTLWRWRAHRFHRHISIPTLGALVPMVASLALGGSDRALLLALPPMAVLAAFALPTLQRSLSAAIDWFSVFFFSLAALGVWVFYLSLRTGVPAKPAANVMKLAPGFVLERDWLALLPALAATLAWALLVRWRTGRHRHPLWKSLVLPAGGVSLVWLLVMTLMLPLIDYARSNRALIERIATHVPAGGCVAAPGADRALIASLETQGGWHVVADPANPEQCPYMVIERSPREPGATERKGWTRIASERRPTDREDRVHVFRRGAAAS